jgi:hypothetical protein
MSRLFNATHRDAGTVAIVTNVYDRARLALGLSNREDMAALLVASQIIHLAGMGQRDPRRLLDATLSALRDISTAVHLVQ